MPVPPEVDRGTGALLDRLGQGLWQGKDAEGRVLARGPDRQDRGGARRRTVAPDVIKEAQDQHLKGHILWEFWTAENSDGFHNPEMARESLTKSIDESQKGIELLKKAMTDKVAAR